MRRAVIVLVVASLAGFAVAGRASPPCEPIAATLAVESVSVDGSVAPLPDGAFTVRALGGGSYAGALYDPDLGRRVVALAAR